MRKRNHRRSWRQPKRQGRHFLFRTIHPVWCNVCGRLRRERRTLRLAQDCPDTFFLEIVSSSSDSAEPATHTQARPWRAWQSQCPGTLGKRSVCRKNLAIRGV